MADKTWQVEQIRWERYWTRGNRAPSTLKTYISYVDKYRNWCEEQGEDSASIDSADLYIHHLQRSSSQHVARYTTRALRAYGDFYADEYDVPNPFAKLKIPPEPQSSSSYAAMATDEDLSKLLGDCDRSTFVGERDFCLITMLAHTGMRRSEVANLKLSDVDLVNQLIHVRKGKTKAAKRTVYMSQGLQGALLRYLKARDELLNKNTSNRKGHERLDAKYLALVDDALWLTHVIASPIFTPSGLGQMLAARGKRVGVDVRAHAFRRMHAGKWMAAGGSEVGLMANSGWEGTDMIKLYTRDVKEANAIAEAQRLFG